MFDGSQVKAQAGLGLKKGMCNHYYLGTKPIGEAAALEMEAANGWPRGFMLDPDNVVNTEDGPPLAARVPIISHVQAGLWAESPDLYHPGDGEGWSYTVVKHGSRAYALRVSGPSMHDPSGGRPSYSDGDIIICDPDQVGGLTTGDCVIALLDDDTLSMDRRTTFKQIVFDGPDVYLKPINPAFPLLRAAFTPIAKVIDGNYGNMT